MSQGIELLTKIKPILTPNTHSRVDYCLGNNADEQYTYYEQTEETISVAWDHRHTPQQTSNYEKKNYANTKANRDISSRLYHRQHALTKLTQQQFIDSQPSHKKQKYMRYLGDERFPSNIITPFIKIEKVSTTKYRAPRLIQARNPKFSMALGRYIKPIEEYIYGTTSKYDRIMKTMNQYQMAEVIMKTASHFRNPSYICLDHSSFDAHIPVEALRMMHTTLCGFYPKDKIFPRLLRATVNNKARTRGGNILRWKGTIASGDVHTSLMGCLLNHYILTKVFRKMKINKRAIMVNGDDSIVIIENQDRPKIVNMLKIFSEYNMETKLDMITNNIYEVEFCRSRIRHDNDGYPLMAINPERLQAVYGMTYKIRSMDYNSYQRDLALANMQIYKHTDRFLTFQRLHEFYQPLSKKEEFKSLEYADPVLKRLADATKRGHSKYIDHLAPRVEQVNIRTRSAPVAPRYCYATNPRTKSMMKLNNPNREQYADLN